ncbi:cytochrome P450 3A24-like [Gigantopelta aegis]|uniref:cytochrome P450 3A24-like n=1 Tax=Gigantopelta aegis TaxID=1735272 RepID=UPI001B8898C6|nr:cytochrome P450 3A24-like [Gigantopelta aegis]
MKRHFGIFMRLGINGPEPSLVCGNLIEIVKKGQFQAIVDWNKQYGKVFGYFEGYTPVLSVSDPEILREILVKDTQNFNCRKPFPLAPRKSLGLFLENGHQWKRSRTILSPAFSSGKLKQMFSIISNNVDILVKMLTEKSKKGNPFDIYSTFQGLTLDVIGRCAFGLHTEAQTDPNDPFLNNIRKLFNNMATTFILPLVMFLPVLSHFIFVVKNIVFIFGMNPVVYLREKMREVTKIRKEMGPNTKIVDLVQLMLFPEVHKSQGQGDIIKNRMTDREIVAQSLTFLLAGYETTSTVLAFLTHVLANNPDVQKRLSEEIERIVGNKKVSYETVQDLPYFDMVFDEVCRLYPTAALIVTRTAAEERTYKGVTIPAGMAVLADVWSLHHNAEYWSEPETFNPERFSLENRQKIIPYSFLPFGAGPRNCIGKRFAIIEAKVAVVKILQNFHIKPCLEDKKPLNLVARGALVPKEEVKVVLVKKDKTRDAIIWWTTLQVMIDLSIIVKCEVSAAPLLAFTTCKCAFQPVPLATALATVALPFTVTPEYVHQTFWGW